MAHLTKAKYIHIYTSWLWIVTPLVFRQLLKFRSEKPVLQGNSSGSCCRAARCCHFKNGMAREGCLVDLYILLHIYMRKDDIHYIWNFKHTFHQEEGNLQAP